jgi:hypothetical protein
MLAGAQMNHFPKKPSHLTLIINSDPRPQWRRTYSVLTILVSALTLSGCFGSSGSTTGDGAVTDNGDKPFVEGLIEYPGPHEKWAGPQTFVVHLNATQGALAQITVTPSITNGSVVQTLSVDAARESLAKLNTALQAKESPFHGCLSPVRVKLIRSDGVLVERQGCRGQPGWPRVASEIANNWMESVLFAKNKKSLGPNVGREVIK